jgi:AmiR/NasT family two-component response regulator
LVAGLNVYANRVAAFDDAAVQTGLLLATHAAALVAAEVNREKAKSLERGLYTNRDIGVAIGILMAQHKITRAQAFNLLRIVSQNSNRKVHVIAEELIETGVLPSSRRAQRAAICPKKLVVTALPCLALPELIALRTLG